ncbi:Frag1/DRAM/Sfk1 family-domain-containing protein [Xylogone sp. PMI_703]|nr:Frag1/DRAM/Sfk1 family-domain-containing protein [Xylogone sp. PMI_703]
MLFGLLSYWIFPVVSSLCWLGTLLGLLIHWNVVGKPHYASMDASQSIAYISDVGAQSLKPLFIAGSAVTVVSLQIGFFADRWLRHRGRLQRNLTPLEKWLSVVAMLFALIGAAGLILLSIFDTLRHPRLHDVFLLIFIVGYIVSAICLCWEYRRLGKHFREFNILRISFYMKLFFIIVEVVLAIAFVSTNWSGKYNAAAVLEWAVAFIFTFWLASFVVDLWPARRTHNHDFDVAAAKRPASSSTNQMEEARMARGHPRPWRDTLDSERTLAEPAPATTAGGRMNGYDF